MSMVSVRRHIFLATPATDVWKIVGDAGGVSKWFPSVAKSSLVGSTREVTLLNGLVVSEEIVTLDDDARRLQYRVLSGISLSAHLATLDVIEIDSSHSLLISSVDVEPDDFGPRLAASIEAAFAVLQELLTAQ